MCSKCKSIKAFKYFTKNKSMADGYHNHCKECRSKYAKSLDPHYRWVAHLQYTYNITEADYFRMEEEQNFKCKICKTDDPKHMGKWNVDHNHTTGKVRGLLCWDCNKKLGMIENRIEEFSIYLKEND